MIGRLFNTKNELPVVIQSENSECGLACVAMISSYYGNRQGLSSLRERYGTSGRGCDLNDIVSISSDLRLTARPVSLDISSLDELKLPAMLHWGMTHFVVLKKVSSKSVIIHDPALGECKFSIAETSRLFTGIAVEFTPAAGFQIKNEIKRTKITDLFVRSPGFNLAIFQLIVLTLFLQLSVVAGSFYLKLVIDDGILKQDLDFILVIALGFGLVTVTQVLMTYIRATVQMYFSTQLGFQMASNVHGHLMSLPVAYFEKRHIGDLMSRLSSTGEIVNTLTGNLITIALDGIFALITLIVMFYIAPSLTAIALICICIELAIRLIAIPKIQMLQQQKILAGAMTNTNIMESIRAIEVIKFYCRELSRLTMWRNFYADYLNMSVRLSKYQINLDGIKQVLFGFEKILIIGVAAAFVIENRLTIGGLIAFIALKTNFVDAANSFIDKMVQIRLIRLQLERVSDITQTSPEVDSFHLAALPRGVPRALSLDGLCFNYDAGRQNVFSDIHLKIMPGEKIVIMGASGAGKSTLLKILAGLLKPSSGTISCDGQDIWVHGVRNYRDLCGGVLQTDQLLSGTIKDNITLFDESVDFKLLEDAVRKAKIYELIHSLPMGYNSLIGDMGSIVSAGQGQRILLARAFYKKPSFLFLDEATANLDPETEADVLNSLKQINVTTVIVSHRVSTCAIADKVYQLAEGKLTRITLPLSEVRAPEVA
jgi:ATP-binding cassette subfamily B protein RaxB